MGKKIVAVFVFSAFFLLVGFQCAVSEDKKDINSATAEDLMQVRGIGKKKAEAIVRFIDARGGIQNMEELLQIKGIGEKTLRRLKEMFEVKPAVSGHETGKPRAGR